GVAAVAHREGRFVFHSPAHPRALHSFPTRRSSDLHGRTGPARPHRATPALLQRRGCTRRSRTEQSRAPTGRHTPRPRSPRSGRGDRKSTRLNSSHVAISYAVFCLKKKRVRTYWLTI